MNLKKLFFTENASAKLCLLLTGALLSLSVTAFAADPTTPCDPQYMDALESRAWLEAQREIAQNKNFIFKPDSVLEYTCFGGFLDEAASNFAPNRQFSETDRWGKFDDGLFTDTTTDKALNEVVLQPMVKYLTSNFNSQMGKYLNNRTSEPDVEYQVPSDVSGGREYNCDQMQQVWLKARCMNFNEEPENDFDGFFDFAYYENTDPRKESRSWGGMCQDKDDRFAAARKSAFNDHQDLFGLASGDEKKAPQGDGDPYEEDDIVTHLDKILPGKCDAKAIKTGVKVERPDIQASPYDEMVCPQPGCSNTPGNDTCTQ